jgi:hypothetical protein
MTYLELVTECDHGQVRAHSFNIRRVGEADEHGRIPHAREDCPGGSRVRVDPGPPDYEAAEIAFVGGRDLFPQPERVIAPQREWIRAAVDAAIGNRILINPGDTE